MGMGWRMGFWHLAFLGWGRGWGGGLGRGWGKGNPYPNPFPQPLPERLPQPFSPTPSLGVGTRSARSRKEAGKGEGGVQRRGPGRWPAGGGGRRKTQAKGASYERRRVEGVGERCGEGVGKRGWGKGWGKGWGRGWGNGSGKGLGKGLEWWVERGVRVLLSGLPSDARIVDRHLQTTLGRARLPSSQDRARLPRFCTPFKPFFQVGKMPDR